MGSRRGSCERCVERYGPEAEVFIALRPDFTKLGILRDISFTGLAFEYVSSSEDGLAGGDIKVDIFHNNSFLLSRLPCKVVYDQPVDSGSTRSPRRCGLQYLELSRHQSEQLGSFVQNHAVRLTSDSQHRRKGLPVGTSLAE